LPSYNPTRKTKNSKKALNKQDYTYEYNTTNKLFGNEFKNLLNDKKNFQELLNILKTAVD